MRELKLAENLISQRHERGITQEALAEFLGVTKASVSKWEKGQSFPDLLLLPRIAAYYDITIDQLLGYCPSLSQEQIRKQYHIFAADFSKRPFEEVFTETEEFAKEYYSCYPMLLQIVVLWMNHYMLADTKERQQAILEKMLKLCIHIQKNSDDIGVCKDARIFEAVVHLQKQNPKETIRILEKLYDPFRVADQSWGMLIQAYQMLGDTEKAMSYSQIMMFSNLLSLIADGILYLSLNLQNKKTGLLTIRWIEQIIRAFDLEHLNPNIALQFHCQAAAFYCVNEMQDQALVELELFVDGSLAFLDKGFCLHGNEYFDRLDQWFEKLDLGTEPVRDKAMVFTSVEQGVELPVFSSLFEREEYCRMKRKIQRWKEKMI